MGMDDNEFDDSPQGEDAAEDFANFDPASYLHRRGNALDGAQNADEPSEGDAAESDANDFANFDPSAYVQKRHAELGHPQLGDASAAEASYGARSRRRRRRAGMEEDDFPEVGAGAGLLASAGRRENIGLFAEILREGGPLLRPVIAAVGCFLVLALIGICAVALLVFNALSRR
jgi:hypothetical protein